MSELAMRLALPICRLFFGARPSTVTRFVVAAIIRKAIKASVRRAWTHVCAKVRIAFHPTSADRDAAASVTRIAWIVRIQAPLFHVLPRVILAGDHAFACVAMFEVAGVHFLGI